MNEMPVTFFAQLLARLKESSPRFYQIIFKNGLLLTAISFAIPYVITDILPGIGIDVPKWLLFINTEIVKWRLIAMGAGLGSAFVAKTTLDTPGTPPLVTDEKPTMEELVAAVAAELAKREVPYLTPTGKPGEI